MAGIEVVSFDMEGTLITHDFSKLIWETDIPLLYAERHGGDHETARNHVMTLYDTVGDEEPEWYDIDYWFERLDLEGDWRELLQERYDACTPYPEVIGVLDRLEGDYRLIVSSNTIREFLEVQLRALPDAFERVFSAPSDFNSVKDASFYLRICGEMDVEPERIVHIGDSRRFDFEAPCELGIHAVLLDHEGGSLDTGVVRNLMEFEGVLRRLP
ncbi:MAG: HAD family hydrolase [Candidatus Bathyarchaeota archaeon]|jgi:putative hydrolase of the HAD superfamily